MTLFRDKDYGEEGGMMVKEGEIIEEGDYRIVSLPEVGEVTSEIRVNMALDQVSLAVGRISEQVFEKDRGTMEYDGENDTYIIHLVPNDLDKAAVSPLFQHALDIWMVIDAHARDQAFMQGVI